VSPATYNENHPLFLAVLKARGLDSKEARAAFLNPGYGSAKHDPYLLPDMKAAVERLALAQKRQEQVVIYGDYDIDGLTATSVLLDAFKSFGISARAFIPNRFIEGYGLSKTAIEQLAADGAEVIVTVDCGSLSFNEIVRANELDVDVIVTDHHTVADTLPPATAVINPKRPDHKYPFNDLAGVGVAFKLVQALQKRLPGLPEGQEKWLLDLVALGTVCDVVRLEDENRANVFWGLKVLTQTRRPGLKALMAISGVQPDNLNARTLGFVLGPRLNAAGRLETAQLSLDLLIATDNMQALGLAEKLQSMNQERRSEQDRIYQAAIQQAEAFASTPVLVLSDTSWSHGIVGIVAAKILERYKKPTFVLQELGEETKGSARSFGDFSAVAAIRASEQWITKGGGHTLAAGVTLKTSDIGNFRNAINQHYQSLKLGSQEHHLEPKPDVTIEDFNSVDEDLVQALSLLEPYGHGNPQPVFCFTNLTVINRREMGSDNQHLKLQLKDVEGNIFTVVGFNVADQYTAQPGDTVNIWATVDINEWRGVRSVEGMIKKLELLS
jgi:single-stranded-DNA-specific exonuclease